MMNEDIGPAFLLYEAEPFSVIKPFKGSRKNKFHILGVRIWVRFVRSEGAKPEE
jgi:hypothetical protein